MRRAAQCGSPQLGRTGSETNANGALLALKGVSKRFGAVQALDRRRLRGHAGEVVALVGDNGAGKSTLIKAISGIYPPTSGEFIFDGRAGHDPRARSDATALGIATVYQDLALCDNLDVVANLFLGRRRRSAAPAPACSSTRSTMEQRSHELLESLSVTMPSVRTEVGTLSGGQRQSVAIARSLLGEPKVVMLDEPTAALGVPQTAQVLELIRRLRERGLGVIVISHNLADVFEVADRIVVLRLGREAATFEAAKTSRGARSSARSPAPGRSTTAAEQRRQPVMTSDQRRTAAPRRRAGGAATVAAQTCCGASSRATSARCACSIGAGADLDHLPDPERPLPHRRQPDQPDAADHRRRADLGRRRARAAARRDRPLGRRRQRPRRRGDGGAERQARLAPIPAIAAGVAVGAAIGALQGFLFTNFGMPSFVVTLAGLLAWQGALLYVLGDTGTVNLTDRTITGLADTFYRDAVGWIMAAVVIAAYAASTLCGHRRSAWRAGLDRRRSLVLVVRVVVVGGGDRRGGRDAQPDRGVPLAVLISSASSSACDYVATRTVFGRHIFAVGGNTEAARRAGISVDGSA